MDWKKVYAWIDQQVLRRAARRRADDDLLRVLVERAREQEEIEARMRARETVMEGIVRQGVFWPGDEGE